MILALLCRETFQQLTLLFAAILITAACINAADAGTSKTLGGKTFRGPLVADGAAIEPVFTDNDIEQAVQAIRTAGYSCQYVNRMDLMPGSASFAKIEVDCDDWDFGYSLMQENEQWVVEQYF